MKRRLSYSLGTAFMAGGMMRISTSLFPKTHQFYLIFALIYGVGSFLGAFFGYDAGYDNGYQEGYIQGKNNKD